MSPVHFTEADMIRLVEIYKDYDCLWNMKHESYRDNEARQTAYKEIAEKLNIPNLGYRDIPKKVKNLRSSYYQEIKRIRRSVRVGGDVYIPRVPWFSTVDGFLKPFRHEHTFTSKRKPVKAMRNVQRNDSNQVQVSSVHLSPVRLSPVRSSPVIAERVTPSKNKIEDEFDSFGKYIASSLRAMPQEFSIIAKTELQKAISAIQLKIVKQLNAGCNPQLSQSTCGSVSASSDYETQQMECFSPASDSCISTIKIEYNEDD